jgi:hypothetical protein
MSSRPALRLCLLLVAVALCAARCDEVPLFAPNGSSITLLADSTALTTGGSTTITALVIEPAGTPPHSGTQVTFLTTLGSVEPSVVTTNSSGFVSVAFLAGNATGTATVSAVSGSASSGMNGSVTIMIAAPQ